MRTSFPRSLVRPGATRSINMPGSFARIVITGTGCQNLPAGTVVRVCFSGRVDDLRTVASTVSQDAPSDRENGAARGLLKSVLLSKSLRFR